MEAQRSVIREELARVEARMLLVKRELSEAWLQGDMVMARRIEASLKRGEEAVASARQQLARSTDAETALEQLKKEQLKKDVF